jgi:hypothetical protein
LEDSSLHHECLSDPGGGTEVAKLGELGRVVVASGRIDAEWPVRMREGGIRAMLRLCSEVILMGKVILPQLSLLRVSIICFDAGYSESDGIRRRKAEQLSSSYV